MNSLYHQQDEKLNELKVKDIIRKIEYLHLLREAGLSSSNWLAYAFGTLSKLIKRNTALRRRDSAMHQARQSHGGKTAWFAGIAPSLHNDRWAGAGA